MIIGHETQLKKLQKDFDSGNLAHGYLLVGEEGVGKRTIVEHLAEKWMGSTFRLDFLALKGKEESVKIKEIRDLVEKVNVSKQGDLRVVLIQNIERMTLAAANSFLKTLEEPPEGTMFMLTAKDVAGILPTITSRVRVMRFAVCNEEEMRSLTNDKDILNFSQGRPGMAKMLIEDASLLKEYKEMWEEVEQMVKSKAVVGRFKFVEGLENEKRFLDLLLLKFRKSLIEGKDYTKELSKIIEAGMLIEKNVNKRLVLENLMLQI